MGCRAPGKPETTVEVLKRDDVPPAAVDEAFHGIEGDAVAGMQSLEILGFAQHLLSIDLLHSPGMVDLLWEDPEPTQIVDEPADCGCGRNWKSIPAAEACEQDLEFLLPEIGMRHAESLDFFEHFQWPHADSSALRRSGSLIQSSALAVTFSQLPLPEEERSPADPEGIHRCRESVLLPKDQNLEFLLRFVGEHTVPPYRSVVAGREVKALKSWSKAPSSHRSG